MKITVVAVSKFRKHFPSRTNEIDFTGESLGDLMDRLREDYGLNQSEHRNLKITINGSLARDPNRPLKEGDRVGLVPVVAGG